MVTKQKNLCVTQDQQAVDDGYMGGPYTATYGYDSQNRLMTAVQSDALNGGGGYYYNMSYSPSGLVSTRTCMERDMLLSYGYEQQDGHISSHRARIAYNNSDPNEEPMTLGWDRDGQLKWLSQPCTGNLREHVWNEAGQLAVMADNERCAYYGYDADGNRAYKLTGGTSMSQYDAGSMEAYLMLDDAVLYVNPYMVVTPRGCTKHYYNGSTRFAARTAASDALADCLAEEDSTTAALRLQSAELMNAQITDLTAEDNRNEIIDELPFVNPEGMWEVETQPACYEIPRIGMLTVECAEDLLRPVVQAEVNPDFEDGIFYCHGDHLGSASWITDRDGNAIQHLLYLPYGEPYVNQQYTDYNERFTFTGKERDEETGYTYHGARYYSPMSYIGWLSPDPLLDDYPGITPYAYCSWNPLKYIDPEGLTDFYNMGGTLVRHIDDGITTKRLLLTYSRGKKKIDTAIKNGSHINVPSNKVIEACEEVYRRTELTGHEYGFRVGNQGTISNIVEGEETTLRLCETNLVELGDYVAYEVHSHPIPKQGENSATPSTEDKEGTVGNQYSYVLGYRREAKSRTNIYGTVENDDVKVQCVTFYNDKGTLNSDEIKFEELKRAVIRINNQEK